MDQTGTSCSVRGVTTFWRWPLFLLVASTATAGSCLIACPNPPVSTPSCASGTTNVDGVCVSQPIADYVACVRSHGASVTSVVEAKGSSAGGAGIWGLSTKAELRDQLEKSYAQLSDSNALEVLRRCDVQTRLQTFQGPDKTADGGSLLWSPWVEVVGWHPLDAGTGSPIGDGGELIGPSPGAPGVSSCGAISPGIVLHCMMSSRKEKEFLTPIKLDSGRPQGVSESMPDCVPTPGRNEADPLSGRLAAACELRDRTPSKHVARIDLLAEATRRCGFGKQGSDAQIRPRWETTLALPDAERRYRVSVDADARDASGDACRLTLGTSIHVLSDGPRSIVSTTIKGGGTLPVVIDCGSRPEQDHGLLVLGCYGARASGPADESPVSARSHLSVTITVEE